MFGRILNEELIKKMNVNKAKKILSPKSDRFFNITLTLWVISAAILTYQAQEFGWNSNQCEICNIVATLLPSIDVATKVTHYPEAMRILWLYLFITSPVMLFILLLGIRDVKRGDMKFIAFLFCLVTFLLALYFIWNGSIWGEGTGYYSRVYRERLYGGIIISSALWSCIVFPLFYKLVYLFSFFKK